MVSRRSLAPDDVLAPDPSVQLFFTEEGIVGVGTGGTFGLEVDPDGLRDTLELVDGRRSVAAICEALAARWDRDEVEGLLAQLHGVVLVRHEAEARPRRTDASPRVVVLGAGALSVAVASELARRGVAPDVVSSLPTSTEEGEPPSNVSSWPSRARSDRPAVEALAKHISAAVVVVCALEGVAGRALVAVDEAATRARVPVLFATVARGACHVGPLHVPARSPCFSCAQLSTTLKELFETSGPAIVPRLAFDTLPASAPPHWIERVATEVAQEVERLASGAPYPLRIGSILSISPSGEATSQRVHLVATCPSCRGALGATIVDGSVPPERLLSRDHDRVCDTTGGSRSVPAEEAQRRALAAFARLDVDVACEPLPDDAPEGFAAIACPFFSLSVEPRFRSDAELVFTRLKGPCFGKGTTDLQARCSAYFEWFERNLADWRGDRELVRASWEQVRERAIDMPFFVAGRLPGLPALDRRTFDASAPIDWVWGHCLRRNEPRLVPAAAVFLCATLFRGSAFDTPRPGSSGLSAGCSTGDALLQGLLEIVERDATFTAIRNGVAHPAVDVEDVRDPAARALLGRIRDAGYEPRIRDITSSIGVPTLEVYVVKRGEYGNHFAMGYGSHLDASIAMRRAVTEAIQTLFGGAPAAATDPLRADSSYFASFPHRVQALERRTAASPCADVRAAVAPVWEQIDEIVSRIGAAIPRADVVAVDLSHPGLTGVRVVRTLVTGVLDEARSIQLHVPERSRLVPLDEMYLGPIAM